MSGGGGEFNPWPSFVDLFTSVIMVLVLLFLIMAVNVGYYAQFKYKVSYTGSISSDNVILNDNPSINKQDEEPEKKETKDTVVQTKNMEKLLETIKILQQQQSTVQQKQEVKKEVKEYTLESAGISINKDDKKDATQQILEKDKYFVITFNGTEIFMEDAVIKRLKAFILNAMGKFPGHSVQIYAQDPENQMSATVAKQISLGRTLSARNLVRKLGYKPQDVNVDLMNTAKISEPIKAEQGYVVIKIIDK